MIISASRRTDIPAWYSKWFFNRLRDGFVYVRNPIRKNMVSKITLHPDIVDCFVFWTKNAAPFIPYLQELSSYMFYVQFTINPYNTSIEPTVPPQHMILNTFKTLSEMIGKERLIWRYDPILLTSHIDIAYHVTHFEELVQYLSKYTNTCVISFVDVYKKNEKQLMQNGARQLTDDEILMLAPQLKQIANRYDLTLQTCSEIIDLHLFGIEHGSCIDAHLIEKLMGMKLNVRKDKQQREACKCVESIDIGEYNSCGHHCLYCYANATSSLVAATMQRHNPSSSLLIGEINEHDCIIERAMKSFRM